MIRSAWRPCERQILRHRLTEKLDQRRHTDFFRRGRHRIGRIDPEHRDTHLQKILEQVAVVAGQLDHEAGRIQAKRRRAMSQYALGMGQPVVRIR